MGVKEQISGGYIESWHDRTDEYELPYVRHAIIVGSDGHSNIGYGITNALRDAGFGTHERNINDLDLMNPQDVDNFQWEEFDTVVFANGYTHLDWIEDQTPDEVLKVVNNKLIATMFGVREFVAQTLQQSHQKNIVIIGSMAASSVLNGSSIYCAACAGVQHFARCIAWELAPKGYRVFLINPSNTEGTPMTEATIQGLMSYRGLDRKDAESYWGAVRALPRWLRREHIGDIVKWLVTEPSAEWLSGVPLNLGGGLR